MEPDVSLIEVFLFVLFPLEQLEKLALAIDKRFLQELTVMLRIFHLLIDNPHKDEYFARMRASLRENAHAICSH